MLARTAMPLRDMPEELMGWLIAYLVLGLLVAAWHGWQVYKAMRADTVFVDTWYEWVVFVTAAVLVWPYLLCLRIAEEVWAWLEPRLK